MWITNRYIFICLIKISIFITITEIFTVTAAAAKLPKSFKRCRRRDPELSSCMKSALKGVLPEFVKGVPSLGVFPIDPLNIRNLRIQQGSGPVSIDLTFINVNMTGIKSASISSVDTDWDTYKIEIRAVLSEPIVLQGDYRINGKVLILPITGTGKCKLKLDNITAFVGVYGKEITKNKKVHMEVNDLQFKFNTTRLHLNFGNLFNGEKALGDNMNRFLNDNWEEILKELHPSIEEGLAQAYKEITNRVFLKVPMEEIVLP